MSNLLVTDHTRVRRHPERGSFDRSLAYAILDEGMVCHVSFVHEGQPVVLPTAYVRVDDQLYLHGAAQNRMLEVLAAGATACVAVTLLDGLVLARSQFHHSMNYRSVVIFGCAQDVTDLERKQQVLSALCEHIAPGRSSEARVASRKELAVTRVLALPIVEASVKRRSGPPLDGAGDLALPHWAGVLPVALRFGAPEPDPALRAHVPASAAVQRLSTAGGWGAKLAG